MNNIKLKTEGYEPFIDFIKAFAIICVLLGHLLPYLSSFGYGVWMGMQVPLFILIQSFHALKKKYNLLDLKKIIIRVLFPYFLLQIVVFLLLYSFTNYSIEHLLSNQFAMGGFGPGSYYPWIYLQISLLLYLCFPYLKRNTNIKNLVIFIVICEGLEVLCSLMDLNPDIYRICGIRYVFLIYLGHLWVEKGIEFNKKTILLSLISLISCIYFYYYPIDNEPFFYNTAWKTHRWPCYFWVANLFVVGLHKLWLILKDNEFIVKSVKLLSKCSYEIFLVQMAVIPLFPALSFISDKYIRFGIRTSTVFILCILLGVIGNKIYTNVITKSTIHEKR